VTTFDFSPIPEHLLHEWTTRLHAGETGHAAHGIAQRILMDFCTRARINQPQSPIALNWLADVLDHILADGKPDARRAFLLMPRREGGKQKIGEAIDVDLWVRIAVYRGHPKPSAIKLAAAVFHKDEKSIARLCRLVNEQPITAESPDFSWDEYFKTKRRPLPRKLTAVKAKSHRTRTRE
jgi:hypothetical protein